MSPEHQALWRRLADFDIDGARVALSFATRLARENGWSIPFARRVVDEYRKFLFLAVAAGHPVTPSDHVDQAWHLHLAYTRSYWDRLCGEVLRRPLHHSPTEGGEVEDAKFHDWYERSLHSYRRSFGTEPPRDIWPPSSTRFGDDAACVRVNLRRNWVIRKAGAASMAAACLAIGASLLLLGGCRPPAGLGIDPWMLAVAGFFLGIAILVVVLRARGCGGAGGSGCGGFFGCGSSGDGGGSSGCGGGGGCGGCGS